MAEEKSGAERIGIRCIVIHVQIAEPGIACIVIVAGTQSHRITTMTLIIFSAERFSSNHQGFYQFQSIYHRWPDSFFL